MIKTDLEVELGDLGSSKWNWTALLKMGLAARVWMCRTYGPGHQIEWVEDTHTCFVVTAASRSKRGWVQTMALFETSKSAAAKIFPLHDNRSPGFQAMRKSLTY